MRRNAFALRGRRTLECVKETALPRSARSRWEEKTDRGSMLPCALGCVRFHDPHDTLIRVGCRVGMSFGDDALRFSGS